MPIVEAVRLALRQIRVQKLKSGFTLLGVTIGVMFLIAVVSIIEGMNRYVEDDLIGKLMTVNAFEVRRTPMFTIDTGDEGAVPANVLRARPSLYERDTAVIVAALPSGVRHALMSEAMIPVSSSQSFHRRPHVATVRNVTHDYFAIKQLQFTDGRPFDEQENHTNALVAVIGSDVRDYFFPGVDPIGRELRIGSIPYRVIGVVERQGNVFGLSFDQFVLVPYGTPVRRLTSPTTGAFAAMIVQAPNALASTAAQETVRQNLRALHRLRPLQNDDFVLEQPQSSLTFWNKIRRYLIVAGVVLPAIGLVVGAIVIMNIMLIAVTERTHEIGIRKSLGARRRDILIQFLIEAATLSTVGAVCGIVVGIVLAGIVAGLSPLPAHVAPWSIGAAVLLGMTVGIVAGVYPASRAAQLDPIAALRAEL